jgi:hypothetical protein
MDDLIVGVFDSEDGSIKFDASSLFARETNDW